MWHAQQSSSTFPPNARPTPIALETNGPSNPAFSTAAPSIIDLWRHLLLLQQHAQAAQSATTLSAETSTSSAPQLLTGFMPIVSNSNGNNYSSVEFNQFRNVFRPPSSILSSTPLHNFRHPFGPPLFPPPPSLNTPSHSSWLNQLPLQVLSAVAATSGPVGITSDNINAEQHIENNSSGDNKQLIGSHSQSQQLPPVSPKGSVSSTPREPADTLKPVNVILKRNEIAGRSAVEQSVPSWLHPSTSHASVTAYSGRTTTNLDRNQFAEPTTIAAAVASLERRSHSASSPLPSPSSIPYFALRRNAHRLSKPRRARTAFTNEQTDALEDEYKRNEYISKNRRHQLASQLGLTEVQIKIWYQNRRAKDKRIEKAKSDRQTRLLTGTTTDAESAAVAALASYSSGNSVPEVSDKRQATSTSVANAFMEYFRYHHRMPVPGTGVVMPLPAAAPQETVRYDKPQPIGTNNFSSQLAKDEGELISAGIGGVVMNTENSIGYPQKVDNEQPSKIGTEQQ